MRNQKIKDLEAEIACNDVLLPRLRTITEEVHGASDGPAQFSRIVEQLTTNPSKDGPQTAPDAPKKLTYDEMILSLLMQVRNDAKEKGFENNKERLAEVLVTNLKSHVVKLGEQQEKLKKELDSEKSEKSKKITSEDIHEGWDSHVRFSQTLKTNYLCFANLISLFSTFHPNPNLMRSTKKVRRRQRNGPIMRFSTPKPSTPRTPRSSLFPTPHPNRPQRRLLLRKMSKMTKTKMVTSTAS